MDTLSALCAFPPVFANGQWVNGHLGQIDIWEKWVGYPKCPKGVPQSLPIFTKFLQMGSRENGYLGERGTSSALCLFFQIFANGYLGYLFRALGVACPFLLNVHFSQVPICPKCPFRLLQIPHISHMPISLGAHLP